MRVTRRISGLATIRTGWLGRAPLVLLAGLAAGAEAQIVTPPPPERPAEAYTPPPPTPLPVTRRAEAAAPNFDPSTVDFEPIFVRLDDGTIMGPREPAEIASLRNNPMIPEDLWPVLDALLEEREAEMNLRIMQNPRLALDLASGGAEDFNVSDEASLQAISDLARAFSPDSGPVRDLVQQGVITEDMGAMSMHIWRNYSQTMTASFLEATRDSEDQNAMLNLQSRFLLGVSLSEAMAAFDRVARGALESLNSGAAKAALGEEGEAFRAEAAKVLSALDDEALRNALAAGVR